MKTQQIQETIEKATAQLAVALNAGHSEVLTAYLKAIGRFHRYSLHTVLLIASQRPNASHVAGFRRWNELGRFVKKGEKGILILAPIVRRKSDTDEDAGERLVGIMGFRAAYVFDISQTVGQELPHIDVVQGDPRAYAERLRGFATGQGIAGDDTHGHVDDISRFVGENTILTAVEENTADENHLPLAENLERLHVTLERWLPIQVEDHIAGPVKQTKSATAS